MKLNDSSRFYFMSINQLAMKGPEGPMGLTGLPGMHGRPGDIGKTRDELQTFEFVKKFRYDFQV